MDPSSPSSAMSYRLTLSEGQADVVLSSLDLLSRLLCLQFSFVGETLAGSSTRLPGGDPDDAVERRLRIDRAFDTLRTTLLGQGGHPYGISQHEADERARAAYDLLQELRYRVSWSRAGKDPDKDPRPSSLLYFDDPLWTTRNRTAYPPPHVEVVDSGQESR